MKGPTMFQRVARRAVLAKLRGLVHGTVDLHESGLAAPERFGERDARGLRARIDILDPSFYVDVMCRGTVGAAEAWVAGHWHCDDPIELVRIFVRNRATLDSVERGIARLSAPLLWLFHRLRRNTKSGSKANIAAHYDLGNDFFERFLDPTMTYSSACFSRPGMTLEQASVEKLDRLCAKLGLQPGDHLLEIGSGWGSMAIHAARHYGCRVTATTISRQQFEFAARRIRDAGLEDRIELLERDYRELDGQYDKLVSVEMIEAVGHEFLGDYMQACSDLLKPDGVMAIQVITIQDQLYERAVTEVDFIKRYIFPGSFIPSITAIGDAMTARTDFRMFHLEDMAPHYAETLRRWRERLHTNRDEILALGGYDEAFLRLWDYYLCYCAGGFEERQLGVAQVVFTKPMCRIDPILPRLDGLDIQRLRRA